MKQDKVEPVMKEQTWQDGKEKDLQQMAFLHAINRGYPQSDKESFETTYWTQHNIYTEGFIAGAKYVQSIAKEVEPVKEDEDELWMDVKNTLYKEAYNTAYIEDVINILKQQFSIQRKNIKQ